MTQKIKRGRLLVVSGPSGVGKGTVIKALMEQNPSLAFSVSATTRAPRPGEIDGVHYYFRSRTEFEEMIAKGELLEFAEYNGNYYGTPLSAVQSRLDAGEDIVLDIEVQGALQVRDRVEDAILIFLMPPSFSQLEERLRGRGTEAEDVIERRLNVARREIPLAEKYDYIVINDSVDEARFRLESILLAESLRVSRQKNLINEVLV